MLNDFDENENIILKQLMKENYTQKYFDECNYIWKNYVPKRGQSNVLQGELLRELEKLRYEAQNNGNINWDEDFEYFCDFISETLCKQDIYSDNEKIKITLILKHFKYCGQYAAYVFDKMDDDETVDLDMIAYCEDNLYDIIADTIGFFQMKNPEPIPFVKNDNIIR